MDKEYIKKLIAELVESIQGCKRTELVFEISKQIAESERQAMFDGNFDFPDLIQEMVDEGSLIEVEYVLPNLSYRIKSFLLPAGTEVTIGSVKSSTE